MDGIHSPLILPSDTEIEDVLQKYFSNSEIKRLKKQNGIKIAKTLSATWLKAGKRLFILTDSEIAYRAEVWWEYHYSLKPKTLKFNSYQ